MSMWVKSLYIRQNGPQVDKVSYKHGWRASRSAPKNSWIINYGTALSRGLLKPLCRYLCWLDPGFGPLLISVTRLKVEQVQPIARNWNRIGPLLSGWTCTLDFIVQPLSLWNPNLYENNFSSLGFNKKAGSSFRCKHLVLFWRYGR
jgi:hypothetical protein